MLAKSTRQNAQGDRKVLRAPFILYGHRLNSDARPFRHLLMLLRQGGHDLRRQRWLLRGSLSRTNKTSSVRCRMRSFESVGDGGKENFGWPGRSPELDAYLTR